ncbi:MAG: hypothetical protein ACRDGN_18110 [bacterium]
MKRPILHRRRSDPPVTVHHGDSPGSPLIDHVGPEGPAEHLRTALMLVRCMLDLCAPVMGNGEAALLVPVDGLAAIQARIEAALERLDDAQRFTDWSAENVRPLPSTCETCGGTILAPTIGGVPRGTCYCPRVS